MYKYIETTYTYACTMYYFKKKKMESVCVCFKQHAFPLITEDKRERDSERNKRRARERKKDRVSLTK